MHPIDGFFVEHPSVAAAIKSGYRMIDTAEAYGNERAVGEGILKSGVDRKELFVVTKVNFKSYENAEQTVMQSLGNLQNIKPFFSL